MSDIARHVLGPLIAAIMAKPGVELREGAVLPSLDPHPVRARYENARPRWLTALQVRGMPFDASPYEALIRNFVIRLRYVFRQFKSEEAMEDKSTWSTFVASARLGGLSPGKAMACVQQDPEWNMFGPDRAPPRRPGRCRHAHPAGAA